MTRNEQKQLARDAEAKRLADRTNEQDASTGLLDAENSKAPGPIRRMACNVLFVSSCMAFAISTLTILYLLFLPMVARARPSDMGAMGGKFVLMQMVFYAVVASLLGLIALIVGWCLEPERLPKSRFAKLSFYYWGLAALGAFYCWYCVNY